MKEFHKNDAFDIPKKISEYVTLMKLMKLLVNVNPNIRIVRYCIFESNYEKSLYLTQESLDIICSPSIGEEQAATFQSVFYAVGYIWAPIHIKIR